MKLEPLGDSAVVATLGTRIDAATLASVMKFAGAVAAAKGRGIVDVVPAYATVTVFYDPAQFTRPAEDAYDEVRRFLEACSARGGGGAPSSARKMVEIPVCYGGDLGPDLGFVAEHAKVGAQEVIERHAAGDYLVHAIGFTPGFPFLGGLPESLRTPRRETPRARVPAGSVGIGGYQTGVYPIVSPGGWQLIGRTPLTLFRADRDPASLLRPGDRVRFKRITAGEFESWK
ncbi:MAG TPA: 5-oxoprolinase subunit PxpB [Opitutaceae bacterium]